MRTSCQGEGKQQQQDAKVQGMFTAEVKNSDGDELQWEKRQIETGREMGSNCASQCPGFSWRSFSILCGDRDRVGG